MAECWFNSRHIDRIKLLLSLHISPKRKRLPQMRRSRASCACGIRTSSLHIPCFADEGPPCTSVRMAFAAVLLTPVHHANKSANSIKITCATEDDFHPWKSVSLKADPQENHCFCRFDFSRTLLP